MIIFKIIATNRHLLFTIFNIVSRRSDDENTFTGLLNCVNICRRKVDFGLTSKVEMDRRCNNEIRIESKRLNDTYQD